jgi:predicted DNA-binding protein (UPF0251 family)
MVVADCGTAMCVNPRHLKLQRVGGAPSRGTNVHLSEQEIWDLRAMWLRGLEPEDIAEVLKIGRVTVYRFLQIPDPKKLWDKKTPWPLP